MTMLKLTLWPVLYWSLLYAVRKSDTLFSRPRAYFRVLSVFTFLVFSRLSCFPVQYNTQLFSLSLYESQDALFYALCLSEKERAGSVQFHVSSPVAMVTTSKCASREERMLCSMRFWSELWPQHAHSVVRTQCPDHPLHLSYVLWQASLNKSTHPRSVLWITFFMFVCIDSWVTSVPMQSTYRGSAQSLIINTFQFTRWLSLREDIWMKKNQNFKWLKIHLSDSVK